MKTAEYWAERFKELENAQHKLAEADIAEIEGYYRLAQKELEAKIALWYQRFAINNEISLAEAKRWLTGKNLEEFKWDVQDYIKYGQENALNGLWMKELENASAKWHISKYEALKIQTRQSLEALAAKYDGKMSDSMTEIFRSGYYHTAFEIQKGFGVGYDIAGLNQDAIEKVISKPWAPDGKNFSSRIWENKQKLVDTIHRELTQDIMLGRDPQKAIDAVAKTMQVSKNQVGRLVMTEEAYFSSAAQKQAFADLGVEQYEIVATLDSHTSEICRELDGKVFKMSDYRPGETAPPFHVYCRSTTAPHFDDDFELAGERAARDEIGQTYYVPADMTYREWEKESIVKADTKEGQDYQPIELEKQERKIEQPDDVVIARKIANTGEQNYYLSEKAKIKPRKLHEIRKQINQAQKLIGVDGKKLPDIIILGETEINRRSMGRYDATNNVLFIKQVPNADRRRHMIIHELIHWRDAQQYIKKHGVIKNQNSYVDYMCKKCKKMLDKLGINEYNVGEIGEYAKNAYKSRRYDEVFTEYEAIRLQRR